MFKRRKLSVRIIIQGIFITVFFAMLDLWIYTRLRSQMYEAKREKTMQVVESAAGVAEHFGKLAADQKLPLEEAQRQAAAILRGMRYEGDQYFWVHDMAGVMVMHPMKPELERKSVLEMKDATGKAFFAEMNQVAGAKGGGFVDYVWPKPGFEKPQPKISYVELYKPWGWLVGSGIYVDDVERDIARIAWLLGSVCLVLTVLSILLSWWMARSIALPISNTASGLGDSAKQMASASAEIARASQSLAQSASEQASAVEETSAAIEEMSSMTRRNAEHSAEANRLMQSARQVSEGAARSMAQLKDRMNDIRHSSRETSSIVKTIDEIAFQTNLLALNAAVEAARAGEAGAGFAVVADEVRNLAKRAGEAAHDTTGLIEDTLSKVNQGVDVVTGTSSAFEEVSGSVEKVAVLVNEIAAASREQSTGIDEINRSITEIDKSVQSNASNSEQTAAVAEEMSAQTEQMKRHVVELVRLIEGEAKGV